MPSVSDLLPFIPNGTGHVPLFCAVEWIATRRGTKVVSDENTEEWAAASHDLLLAAVEGRVEVFGVKVPPGIRSTADLAFTARFRNYRVDEVAPNLGITKTTVRRGLKNGLPALTDRRPQSFWARPAQFLSTHESATPDLPLRSQSPDQHDSRRRAELLCERIAVVARDEKLKRLRRARPAGKLVFLGQRNGRIARRWKAGGSTSVSNFVRLGFSCHHERLYLHDLRPA
jgi:hypothetical protein